MPDWKGRFMNTSKRDLTRIRHNTKIVATLGPGSNNVQLLEDMIRVGGLNVVRFNFSHGTAEFHQENALKWLLNHWSSHHQNHLSLR